jgi:hypothetical protein
MKITSKVGSSKKSGLKHSTTEPQPDTQQDSHDTWAVFLATIQVIGPIILLLLAVVLGSYGLLHLLFLRG